MLRKLNNNSDFDFTLNLLDAQGESVGWLPDANWELTLYTVKDKFVYNASYAFGEKLNCYEDGGNIHIVVDRHQFPVGELVAEITVDVPDKNFPDGYRHSVGKASSGIEMVVENGNEATNITVDIRVPNLKKETAGDSACLRSRRRYCDGISDLLISNKDRGRKLYILRPLILFNSWLIGRIRTVNPRTDEVALVP